MKILIVGSGGREHAIVWALQHKSASPLRLFCAPGNAGIAQTASVFPIGVDDYSALVSLVRQEGIDLTFVGPEAPLAAGLVDRFMSEGLAIVGPQMAAARLEGSKVFAKQFMARHQIPTAPFCIATTASEAVALLRSGAICMQSSRIVLKADGLAAGKGVVVANSLAEAETAVEDLMVRKLVGQDAAQRLIIEEALEGPEVSLLLFSDGKNYALMPPARDHKRIGENDTGPNTGGMGSITDESLLTPSMLAKIVDEIVEPTLAGCRAEGFPFKGVLFLGLMLTEDGPRLLEYNVRFGDPETQAILIRLQTDLLSVFQAIRSETLSDLKVEWSPGSSACVVLASAGYPARYETGAVINGLDQPVPPSVEIFHAGTANGPDGAFVTSGGRVLGVTSAAPDLREALSRCYRVIGQINWSGMQFRGDIGSSVLG